MLYNVTVTNKAKTQLPRILIYDEQKGMITTSQAKRNGTKQNKFIHAMMS